MFRMLRNTKQPGVKSQQLLKEKALKVVITTTTYFVIIYAKDYLSATGVRKPFKWAQDCKLQQRKHEVQIFG